MTDNKKCSSAPDADSYQATSQSCFARLARRRWRRARGCLQPGMLRGPCQPPFNEPLHCLCPCQSPLLFAVTNDSTNEPVNVHVRGGGVTFSLLRRPLSGLPKQPPHPFINPYLNTAFHPSSNRANNPPPKVPSCLGWGQIMTSAPVWPLGLHGQTAGSPRPSVLG